MLRCLRRKFEGQRKHPIRGKEEIKTVLLFLFKGFGAILSFLLGIIISRTYSPSIFANYNVLSTYLNYFFYLSAWGIHVLIIEDSLNGLSSTLLKHSICISLFFTILAGIVFKIIGLPIYLCLIVPIGSFMMIKDSVLIVQNRQLTNAVYNDILRFLMPILILAAIFHFPLFKGIGFFSAYTFSQILYGISLLLIINSIFQRKACCNPHSFSVIIKKGIIPTISALLVLSTAQFDRILLSLLMPSESLAIYFMAQNINTLITYATLSITAVITPILVNGYKEENREAISRITRRYSAYIFSFTFVIGLLSLIYGKQYFTLYNVTSNEGYIPLIVLIFSMAFSQLFGFGITLSTFNDRKKRLIVYQLVSLSIIIILDLVLVPKYQALGAAIGSATSTVAIRFMAWLDYKKTGYNVGII